jgi:hypothetical protein
MDEWLSRTPEVRLALQALDKFQMEVFNTLSTLSNPADLPKVVARNAHRLDWKVWLAILIALYVTLWLVFALVKSFVRSMVWMVKLSIYVAVLAGLAYYLLPFQQSAEYVWERFTR